MKSSFSGKKGFEMSAQKIIGFILLIIVAFIIWNKSYSLIGGINDGLNSLAQAEYSFECKNNNLYCDRVVKDCSTENKIEENKCTSFEIDRWKTYQLVKDCDSRRISCSDEEKQQWEAFKKAYVDEKSQEAQKIIGDAKSKLSSVEGIDPKVVSELPETFILKVNRIAFNLNTKPEFLLAVMSFETGGTFNPCEKNKAGSGATGLIQFMPSTAKGLGTTTDALCKMTQVEQMDYVEKYFMPYKGKLNNIEDVYMAVLWPKAIGKGLNYELFTNQIQYDQNKGLDKNKDGKITVAEATLEVNNRYQSYVG